jgi:lysophospholipase L1-like esterase
LGVLKRLKVQNPETGIYEEYDSFYDVEARTEIDLLKGKTANAAPRIGDNGNWYIGDEDTGVKAAGADGEPGKDGQPGADGQDGTPGKSAYEYAQDGGYTGTEEEFAEKLAAEIPDALPNPYPLTINGKAYNGSEAVDVVITGGTAGGNISLGQTPVTLAQSASIKLVGDGEHSYTIKGKTIADISTISVSEKTNVEITEYEDYIELSSTGTTTEWYNAYATLSVTGLTVGTKYILGVVKTETVSVDNKIPSLYIMVKNSSGTTLGTMNGELTGLNTLEFTPDTTDVTLYWYVASYYYWDTVGCTSTKISDLYINKSEDGTERTDVVDKTGTFTDSYSLGQLSKGITITSEPSCEVYNVSNESESGGVSAPLAGKTVVCFGDSLFGMYTGDTSAPAFIAQKTGATVHNVGFGGCRMSVHPYVGYNEFCMYALATAIASGDWSLQDAAASEGSANFPDQLAILKSIDFSAVDYIVIHYGTNDFNGVSIDNASNPNDYNTLCGALRYSIETLLGAFPKLKIFVSLPAFRYWTADDGTVTYSDTWKNVNGHTLPDFVKALADTAKEYKLPVIDCYYGLGINKSNAATFLADGTHHNIDGRKLFGEYIGAKLISYGDTFHGTDSKTDGVIDVTASVGQTIVVKEVDADGKPTKWDAVDYQPRTHWKSVENVDIIPKTTFVPAIGGLGVPMFQFATVAELEVGKEYTVIFDGVEYICQAKVGAVSGMSATYLGNEAMFGNPTTEPFAYAVIPDLGGNAVQCFDTNEHTIQISIEKEVVHKIPDEYVASNDFKVEFVGDVNGGYIAYATLDEMVAAYKAGKNLYGTTKFAKTGGTFGTLAVEVRCPFAYLYEAEGLCEIAFCGFASSAPLSPADRRVVFRVSRESGGSDVVTKTETILTETSA